MTISLKASSCSRMTIRMTVSCHYITTVLLLSVFFVAKKSAGLQAGPDSPSEKSAISPIGQWQTCPDSTFGGEGSRRIKKLTLFLVAASRIPNTGIPVPLFTGLLTPGGDGEAEGSLLPELT